MAFLIVLVKEHTSFFYHVKLSEDLSAMYIVYYWVDKFVVKVEDLSVMYTAYCCVDKFVVKVRRENNSQ